MTAIEEHVKQLAKSNQFYNKKKRIILLSKEKEIFDEMNGRK